MRINLDFKIAFRSILKNKVQSVISILGLGIGMGSILLLILLSIHEYSFNETIPDNDKIFRIVLDDWGISTYPLAEAAMDEVPGVENYFRIFQKNQFNIKTDDNEIILENDIACADHDIFNIWGVNFLLGHPAKSKYDVAISEKMAMRYFNSKNPVGKSLRVRLSNEFINLTVCGVFKNFRSNSTLYPEFVCNIDLFDEFLGERSKMLGAFGDENSSYKNDWQHRRFVTFLKLNSEEAKHDVEIVLQKYLKRKENKELKRYSLQPVTEIYLNSDNISGDQISRRGNAEELKYYIIIAIFILIIAIANYIFLSKAQIDSRLREIGAKKTLGASAFLIRRQIILESNLIALFSLLPALIVIELGITFINSTLNRTLELGSLSFSQIFISVLTITLVAGTLSGIIIGTRISKIPAILLLNRKTILIPRRAKVFNSFLSLHFAIFIILIIGVLTVTKQVNYALSNFQEINPDKVLICELNSSELSKKIGIIQDELEQIPGVVKTAGSSFVPPFNLTLPLQLKYNDEIITFDGLIMGQGMTTLLEMNYLEGGPFGEYGKGSREVIFNEAAAKKYNLKAGEFFSGFKIQGIVKDFTAHSLRELIQPMAIIQQHPERLRLLAIKTSGENDHEIISRLSTVLKEVDSEQMVNIYSLDEQIKSFYSREENQGELISAFSILATVLSVMGLLGMVLNTNLRKQKEIGIRKVNGATISEILTMLNKDFVKWVVIAFVLACPIAWYAMSKWLENFAYKTTLSWWIFALAGALALGIALLTVSWQSWRAATRNPVEALRYE
ncbi:ABC transporter permease [uncultured Sunxiuqinia sp.]|uniref:ABC transporter permease n=1 Tax=uncultured Sunxiuqinia sp. TaxID=1573825 RepID=UPI0026383D0F|nr:ABC transporter permease [uncultured Sunxiuqinia sp.]